MSVIRRFQVADNTGRRYTIVEYRITEHSAEIRSDRSSGDPIHIDGFETLEGVDVIQIGDDVLEIASTDKVVRKV